MNIFILSENPQRAAQYHCDKHVVKMVLESAQLLCSAHHIAGHVEWKDKDPHVGPIPIYHLSHPSHPCTLWAVKSVGNYLWLLELFEELLKEYTKRYKKIHSCSRLLPALRLIPQGLPRIPRTEFVTVMPDEYVSQDPVESYRRYYREGKSHLLTYKFTDIPYFLEK